MFKTTNFLLFLLCIVISPPRLHAQPHDTAEIDRQADNAYCARDFKGAIQLSIRALDLASGAAAQDPEFVAGQLDRLLGASEKLRDYASAELYALRLLDLRERQFGKDSLNSSFFMEAAARLLAQNGKIDEADALYSKIPEIRSRSLSQLARGVKITDPFAARHAANAARIYLKRKQWRRALETYAETIRLIDESVAPMGSGDDLADSSSELNVSTFTGLARAAWELSKTPGKNARALLEKSFEAMQWKWRTPAAVALQKAAARTIRSGPSLSLPPPAPKLSEREKQDREEHLQRLKDELEDLVQVWFAARDKHAAFKVAWKTKIDAGRDFMNLSPTDREQVLRILGELTRECLAKNPPCNVDMHDAMAKSKGRAASPTPGQTVGDYIRQVEKEVPGWEDYERKQIELNTKIGELNSSGPVNMPTVPERRPPTPTKSGFEILGLSRLQSLLRDDEALLTFLVGNDEGFVWAVTRERATWSPIPVDDASLVEAVGALRAGLEPPTPSAPNRLKFPLPLAHELYKKLFAPIESLVVDKRHLFIVPTGALTGLPFQVLITQEPNAALPELVGYRQASWLARRHALSTLPGVASLRHLREELALFVRSASPFIGFGDPDFDQPLPPAGSRDRQVLANVQRCSRSKAKPVSRLSRLPDTRKELEAVRAAFPTGEVHLGRDASKARINSLREIGALHSYRILYFATHGLVTGDVDGLLEPALALNDGLLRASEIAQFRLNADLVVLSACNTAGGRRPGEETLSGLARAFLYAGARAVLVSHWLVDSFAATKLATTTFQGLASDPPIGHAEALRRAMLDIIDHGDPVGAHPSYWAPFVIVGDGMNDSRG